MKVNLGGTIHLSTVDWYGLASIVIFLRGCPLRCPHCQNEHLQSGESFCEMALLERMISEAAPFVSAVVFSGGEPLMQALAVREISSFARRLGLLVGLETCGYYPDRLASLLEDDVIDRVFLDIKAELGDPEYARATGKKGVARRVRESLETCIQLRVPFEMRITVFPEMPKDEEIIKIAELASSLIRSKEGITNEGRSIRHTELEDPLKLEGIVLQQGQPRDKEFEPVSVESLNALAKTIDHLIEVRVRGNP